jgi:RNA polymerase sigma-70 factor (ECF subfamily)
MAKNAEKPNFPDNFTQLSRIATEVYDELRRYARFLMRDARRHTLQPTAVANEAFIRLVEGRKFEQLNDLEPPARRIVIVRVLRDVWADYHKTKSTQKRGGGFQRVPLADWIEERVRVIQVRSGGDTEKLLACLQRLAEEAPVEYEVIQLRIWQQKPRAAVAEALGVSPRTVTKRMNLGLALLRRCLNRSNHGEPTR